MTCCLQRCAYQSGGTGGVGAEFGKMDEFRLGHIKLEVPQDRSKRLADLEIQVWSQRETFEIAMSLWNYGVIDGS